jgi:hypothetical protein
MGCARSGLLLLGNSAGTKVFSAVPSVWGWPIKYYSGLQSAMEYVRDDKKGATSPCTTRR